MNADTTATNALGAGADWRISRRRLYGDAGQSLVEFALASVVFFMTIFGTIEFGLAIWQYNMMSDLAQEGARWASVHGPNGSAPASAGTSDVQTYVNTRTGFTVTVTTTPTTVGAAGSTISVTVASTFTPGTSFIPNSTMQLSSTSSMIVSR